MIMKSAETSFKSTKTGIKQVAEEVGCSVSTVSRILNNYSNFHVSQELRDKVADAVRRNNYTPHPILRTIKAKKTWMVSFLERADYSYAMKNVFKRSFAIRMQEEGFQVGTNFLSNSEKGDYYPQWPVDGVALADTFSVGEISRLDTSGIPYVSINGIAGENGVSIVPDEESGIRLALDHLRRLGHSRIAYADFIEWARPHFSIKEREVQYKRQMKEAGCSPVPACDNRSMDAVEYLKRTVLEHGATAVLCYNQFIAIRILQAAWRLGINVPGKLSVICFGDEDPAKFMIPPLTCIALPAAEMGRLSGEILSKMIRKEGDEFKGRTIKLPCSLASEESCAALKERQ